MEWEWVWELLVVPFPPFLWLQRQPEKAQEMRNLRKLLFCLPKTEGQVLSDLLCYISSFGCSYS